MRTHKKRPITRRNPDKAEAPGVPPRIVEILSVRDTRTYVEVSPGVWNVDNDSGEWRVCPRCGQQHVIHATVRLDNGRTEILGKECARRDSTSMAKKVDAAFAAQAAEDKLRRSIVSLERASKDWERGKADVEKLSPPPVEVLGYAESEAPLLARDVPRIAWGPPPARPDRGSLWYVGLRCGDVFGLAELASFHAQHHGAGVVRKWREARLLEQTGFQSVMDGNSIAPALVDARKKLSRLLAKREKE